MEVSTVLDSAASGLVSTFFRKAGGLGVDRPLTALPADCEDVPPTRRRVGVRRIVEPFSSTELSAEDAARLVEGFRVRDVDDRRVLVVEVVDLRPPERRTVAALVAALSSPFGEAASSETSGLADAAARERA